MADPPSPTRATIPSAISVSKPKVPDTFHPVAMDTDASTLSVQSHSTTNPNTETHPPSDYDYTENAPQAAIDAIAIERAREAKEGPPDMMVGSFQSWMGASGGKLHVSFGLSSAH
jgi:cation-transporting ATPase 13A2